MTSYGDIVRAQFAKHRDAVWCLRMFGALFLLATYAPVLSLDVPFMTDLDREGFSPYSFPWFRALIDPAVFRLDVDVFFNLLMGTLPLLGVAWLATRERRRLRPRVVGTWCLLHVALFLFVAAARDEWRLPSRDYPREVQEAGARAVFPPVPHHPNGNRSEFKLTPILSRGHLAKDAPAPPEELWPFYLLGSDNLGNDVFTRLLYGARISLSIGIIAVAIYITVGVALGAVAGYAGGWVDDLLMFLAQAVMVVPYLFLILFIMSVVKKPSIYHIMLVIAALGWPGVMRLVRGEFLRQRELDYVSAARALGLADRRVIFRHIVPNALAPVFVSATFGVAGAILTESTLAFLGLGDQQAPSWGQMLNVGRENLGPGDHLVWAGGLAIFLMVLVMNVIGEALRDALDPKLRK